MNIPDDPFIQELLPEFVDTWLNDMETKLPLYIETKNATDLYRLAHTLKGSCFQFGIDEVAQKGIELMTLAKAEEWDKSLTMGNEIIDMFKDAKQFLIDKGLYQG